MDIEPQQEASRLSALNSLRIDNGDHFVALDRLVHLATSFFHVPIAAIALIDESQQCFVARAGLLADRAPRMGSICTQTIFEDRLLVIPDLSVDVRWCSSSFHADGMALGFYAGIPIHVSRQPVGTFCLLDHYPHPSFDDSDGRLLHSLALVAEDLLTVIQLRRSIELPSRSPEMPSRSWLELKAARSRAS